MKENAKIYRPDGAQKDAVKGKQVPVSAAEAKFKARCMERGWIAHRPSWPDFIVETETGLVAVEVKSEKDQASDTQRVTFDLLESMGVRVYVWKDADGMMDKLSRWKRTAG